MSKHIRTFESFQGIRRNTENETVNETVIQRDSSFIVGGVKVDKKTINAYAKKVKDQTGKDLKSMYSEMEIAEELVKWSVDSLDNIDNVPVSALMGGEEEMAQDLDDIELETELDETGEVSDELDDELDVDMDLNLDEDDTDDVDSDDTDGDDDLELDLDDEDFESPTTKDEDEDDTDELDLDLIDDENSGEDDEEDELPI